MRLSMAPRDHQIIVKWQYQKLPEQRKLRNDNRLRSKLNNTEANSP